MLDLHETWDRLLLRIGQYQSLPPQHLPGPDVRARLSEIRNPLLRLENDSLARRHTDLERVWNPKTCRRFHPGKAAGLTFEALIASIQSLDSQFRAQAARAVNLSLTLRNCLKEASVRVLLFRARRKLEKELA